jgi:spore coat polysaccharide biosynthesis protein SpsF
MTLRLIERLRTADTIDEIVICTSNHPDDAILLDLAQEWGVEALAGSEEDVLSRFILAAERYDADLVIRVTGDNVLTDSETIDRMVARHIAAGAEYTRTNGLPLGVTAEVMSAGMLSRLYNLMPDPNQSEYMMLYAFDPDRFNCQVLDAPPEINRPNYSLTVDTPEDLALVRRLYAELPRREAGPHIADIVAMLDEDPGRLTVSDETPIRLPGGETKPFGEMLKMLSDRAEKAHRKYGG